MLMFYVFLWLLIGISMAFFANTNNSLVIALEEAASIHVPRIKNSTHWRTRQLLKVFTAEQIFWATAHIAIIIGCVIGWPVALLLTIHILMKGEDE